MAIKLKRNPSTLPGNIIYEPGDANMTARENLLLSKFPLVNQYPHYTYARARGQTWALMGTTAPPKTTKQLQEETAKYKTIKCVSLGLLGIAAFVFLTDTIRDAK